MTAVSVFERVLALMPEPGETPREFTARSEHLRRKWLRQAAAKRRKRSAP